MIHAQAQADALLLVGHGTRDRGGCEQFARVAQRVAERLPNVAVEHGFLELARPTIAEAIERLSERDVQRLTVMPMLLLAAGHAKQDVPEAITSAVARHPVRDVRMAGHFGCHDKILELSALRYGEAVAERDAIPAAETLLVLVGRGSRDSQATAEMLRFAELRGRRTPVGGVATCFLAMAEPSLDAMLEAIGQEAWSRIVVQPHLLFQGELLGELRAKVAQAAQGRPDVDWLSTPCLGPHPLVADAIIDRARTANPNLAVRRSVGA